MPGLKAARPPSRDAGAAQRRAVARRFLAQRGLPAPGDRLSAPALKFTRHAPARPLAQQAAAGATAFNLAAPWTPLGPAQTITPAYGAVTGRVTTIAVDTGTDPSGNTVYVGTTGGGVWKSINAAAAAALVRFTPLTDEVPAVMTTSAGSLSIGALSVQPGGTGVVLAGTGDPNDSLDSYYGEGILRSADGGATWTSVDEADASFGTASPHSFQGEGFAGFAWSSTSTNLVVAAVTQAFDGVVVNALQPDSEEGLYYSTDAGITWQLATIEDGPGQVVQGPDSIQAPAQAGVFDGNAATAVVWNPVRQLFIAAIRYHGYYESADGVTWTRLARQPGSGMTSANCPANPGGAGAASCPVFRGALAVQPVTGDLFALTVDQNDLDQGLWWDQCTQNGVTCPALSMPGFAKAIDTTLLEDGTGAIAQGDYNLWLAAVPVAFSTDTLLYAGTEDIFKRSLAASNVPWLNTTNWADCTLPLGAGVAPSQHAVGTAPVGASSAGPLLYFGNDSGLWRTADGINKSGTGCLASDASHFDNLNAALGSLAEVTSVAGDPASSSTLVAAEGANGTAASASATNNAWPQVLDGYSAYVAIDAAQPLDWYATAGPGVSIYACPDGASCNAADFPALPLVGDPQTASDGEELESPSVWMLDPQDHTQMIVGTCRLWRGSIAGGSAQWTPANALSPPFDIQSDPGCNGEGQIRSLGASGTLATALYGPGSSQEILYAGMAGTWDGGQTAAGHLYTASIPAGAAGLAAWTDLYASPVLLPDGTLGQFNPGGFAISSVVVDTHDTSGQTVYATIQGISGDGTSVPTLYRSTSQGQSWTNITANLPLAPANALLVDPGDASIVYVATDAGVYVTTAVATCGSGQQQCWNAFGTALPDVPVTALVAWGTGNAGLVRAATYGRGIWQAALVSAQESTLVPPAAASLNPTSLTFPAQTVGTLSATQSLSVTNTSASPLVVGAVTLTGDFDEQDTCGSPVAPGAACTVTVAFFPTSTGARDGLLTLSANVPGGQLTASLQGSGTPAGQVILTPLVLNFPATAVGATAAAEYITVSNTGAQAITLQPPMVTGSFHLSGNTCTATLAPNTGCTAGLLFSPTAAGTATGTFSIATESGPLVAMLKGTGLAPATDTLSANSLQFIAQLVGTVSAAQAVTIRNTGGLVLTSITVSSSTADFVASDPGCLTGVPGGGSCTVLVAFAPRDAGTRTGTLTITDSLHTQTLSLSGTGVAPAGVPSITATLVFPAEGVAGSAGYQAATLTSQAVTLTNNGTAAISSLQLATTGDFTAASGTCGSSLGAGASCQPQVKFSPAQTGARTGALTVTGSGLARPLTTSLSGEGLAFAMAVSGDASVTVISGKSASYLVNITPVGASAGSLSLGCSGAPAGYACTPDAGDAAGTVVLAGGATHSVTVTLAPTTAAAATGLGRPWQLGSLVLACLLPLWPSGRRRRLSALAALLLLIAGCGTKATGGGTGGGGSGGVTPSSYTVTLTASAPGVAQSVSMTLLLEQ